jgi:carboxypeptidase T
MSKITAICFFILISISYSFSQKYSSCKIDLSQKSIQELSSLGISADHGTHKKGHYFITDLSEFEISILNENNFSYEILIDDVSRFYQERSENKNTKRNSSCVNSTENEILVPENFNLGSMAGFYTYEEFLNEIDQMFALYPNLISAKAPISDFLTHENRPIYYLKISDNPNVDEDEPEILYSSIHHAREPMSLTSTIFYMWYLLENYENNPEIQFLVNETEMFFIPLLNPDGYIQNQTTNPNGGGMFRKNKRNNGDGTFGVDLNRNYNHAWGTTGVSFNTSSDTYPGTGPFSEPETQAMKWFCEQRDLKFAFNAHSYSNLILFPIGSSTDAFAEDHDYFQNISNEMVRYNNFIAQKSSALYPASGDSDDYMYMEELDLKPKIFAFTPEIGSDADGFWPAEIDITDIAKEMIYSNLILAKAAHNFWTVKETDPNAITELAGNFNHEVMRLGLMNDGLTVSIEPLQGIQSVGNAVNYNLNLNETGTVQIAYTLNSNINLGDEIKYVLVSDFSTFTQRDTIIKTYGNPTLQYQNNGNSTDDWTGTWGITSVDFVSPSSSFTDSPSGDYQNFTYKTFELNNGIDLTNATAAKVQFYAKWEIEDNYDYVSFEVSSDNGETWTKQCGKYTNAGVSGNGGVQPEGQAIYDGIQSSWVLEEISLNDYLGQTLKFRFVLQSDAGLRMDGFYFDDFEILHNSSTAKIKENGNEFIKIFPNPAQDFIVISSEENMHGGEVKILNQLGQEILVETINFNTNKKEISIADFSVGVYFLEFKSKNGRKTLTKLMKSK